jgi:hypothetical protein
MDLFLRSHRDLHGLPAPSELHVQLREAGFAASGEVGVLPGGTLRIVWARAPEMVDPSAGSA